MAIPLGRRLHGTSCNQPGRLVWKWTGGFLGHHAAPIRSCSRWGFPCRPCCQGRGALLPHPFTLTLPVRRRTKAGRFAFCGTVPGVAPAGGYPAPFLHGARTFLSALDTQALAERPSGLLTGVIREQAA